jgi:hypothetical protein
MVTPAMPLPFGSVTRPLMERSVRATWKSARWFWFVIVTVRLGGRKVRLWPGGDVGVML